MLRRLIRFVISILNEMKTLYYILFSPIRGETHEQRLDNFYVHQAKYYDEYRKRLLICREDLFDRLPSIVNGIWIDMGCGTAFNLEYMFKINRLKTFKKIYLIDLSSSLLDIARQRIQQHQWTNIEIIHSDVTQWKPNENEQIDLITFSYSLTMIPDWFLAIDNAKQLLKPNGYIGITDFYISRKYPQPDFQYHSWFIRIFAIVFFSFDNVYLTSDHLSYVNKHFHTKEIIETFGSLPYLPFCRVPHYIYIGRNKSVSSN